MYYSPEKLSALLNQCIDNQSKVLDLTQIVLIGDEPELEQIADFEWVEELKIGFPYFVDHQCYLKKMPQLPVNLIKISAIGTAIKELPSTLVLPKLEELVLNSKFLGDFSMLENTPELKKLEVNSKISPAPYFQKLKSLKHLELGGDMDISDISELKHLIQLEFLNLSIRNIETIEVFQYLKNLKILNISFNPIKDITPLGHLENLVELSINIDESNSLDSFKNLKELKKLNIWDSQVSDISPLSFCAKLEQFTNFRNKKLISISPLGACVGLKELTLSNNGITDCSAFSTLTQLNCLDLSSNNINDIGALKYLAELKELNISENHISSLEPLKNMIQLEYLYANNNRIIDISPLGNLKNLTSLTLSNNQLTDVSILENFEDFSTLNLSDNRITSFPNMPIAETYYIDGNPILKRMEKILGKDIDLTADRGTENVFPWEDFNNYSKLREKGIEKLKKIIEENKKSKSKKIDLGNLCLFGDEKELEDLKKFEWLEEVSFSSDPKGVVMFNYNSHSKNNIAPNYLESLPELPISLKKITANSVSLKDVSSLSGLIHLEKLELSLNQIEHLDALAYLPNLKMLDVEGNLIKDITVLEKCDELRFLNLRQNNIYDFSVIKNLPHLNQLLIQCPEKFQKKLLLPTNGSVYELLVANMPNDLSKLANYTHITKLHLSGQSLFSQGKISDISFLESFSELTHLTIYGHKVKDISVLEKLKKLEVLDLRKNELTDVSVMSQMTQLKTINLSNNEISDLSFLKQLPDVEITIHGNPIEEKIKQALKVEGKITSEIIRNYLGQI